MKSKNTFKILLVVLLSFAAYYMLFINFRPVKTELDKITHQGLTSYILTYFFIGIPLFAGTYLIERNTNIFKSLGLSKGILTGIWTGILFSLPMFAGGLVFFTFNQQYSIENLIAGTLVAGFMEELYFRGFLFGLLFKNTKLGFIPSIFFGALVFAGGHLYQSHNMIELSGILTVTFLASFFFAWLYVEWNFNLWVPILIHTFMNLSWNFFDNTENALGGLYANIFRSLTIILAIVFTILYKRNNNQHLYINKRTILVKKEFSANS